MSNIEKIRQEIERMLTFDGNIATSYYIGKRDAERELKSFIDSLPKDEPSKELEEAAWDCVLDSIDVNNPVLLPKYKELLLYLFKAGTEWQKEQMMKDAEEDALLLERAWLTLDGFGHEELAGRLRQFAERKGLIWK